MIVFIYDTETTGLDPDNDRIVQHGLLVYDLVYDKVIDVLTILTWEKDFPVVASSGKVHGWTLPCLIRHATHPGNAIQKLREAYYRYNPVAVIGHNATKYDRSMYRAERLRLELAEHKSAAEDADEFLCLPWLDTQHHAEYDGCPNKALLTIAAHHEFLNPFPHDAVSDCFTLVSIFKRNPTLILTMAKRAAATMSVIFANIPQGINVALNAQLKLRKFSWQECDGEFYQKSWIRKIERERFDDFVKDFNFEYPINIIKDIPAPDKYVALYRDLSEFYDKKWHA